MVSIGIGLKCDLNAFNSINTIKCLLCARHKANLWGCKNEAKNSCLQATSRPHRVLWCVAWCDKWQDAEELTEEECLGRQVHLLKRCRNLAAGKEDRVGEALRADRQTMCKGTTAGAHTSHSRNQQWPGMERSGRGAWRREAWGSTDTQDLCVPGRRIRILFRRWQKATKLD